jgi:hypothetical protein
MDQPGPSAHDGAADDHVPSAHAPGQDSGNDPPRIGLVVGVPKVVKAADVDALTNFTWLSGWILLGVITYAAPRKWIPRPTHSADPAGSGRDSSVVRHAEVDAW